MQRKQDGLIPIGEVFRGLDGPVKAIREASSPTRLGFTQADQVNQLVSAREADADLGFMARLMALCSLPLRLAWVSKEAVRTTGDMRKRFRYGRQLWGVVGFPLGLSLVIWLPACQRTDVKEQESPQVIQDAAGEIPLGLVPRIFPRDNPYSKEKAELGRLLYFDTRLSADNTIACASCHQPDLGFSDGQPTSAGIGGQRGGRNAPTVINRAYSVEQFWDGRAPTLEEQAKGPIASEIEMGNTHAKVVATLAAIPEYRRRFREVFGSEDFTIDHVAKAIATFERTVISGNSPYDRYKAGDPTALSESARRGLDIFINKAKCDKCHFGINLTDGSFANLGVGMDKPNPDPGRYRISGRPEDWGAFKAPTLREVARSAPYMHDGSLKTLQEVVEYYNKGGIPNKNLDERIKPLNLTEQEKRDMEEFLKSLSGEGWQHATAPESFPS